MAALRPLFIIAPLGLCGAIHRSTSSFINTTEQDSDIGRAEREAAEVLCYHLSCNTSNILLKNNQVIGIRKPGLLCKHNSSTGKDELLESLRQ